MGRLPCKYVADVHIVRLIIKRKIHTVSLRTSMCVCKYLHMLSTPNSVFCHFHWPWPYHGPELSWIGVTGSWPLYANLTFYILSVEMAISLRQLLIPVFHYECQPAKHTPADQLLHNTAAKKNLHFLITLWRLILAQLKNFFYLNRLTIKWIHLFSYGPPSYEATLLHTSFVCLCSSSHQLPRLLESIMW